MSETPQIETTEEKQLTPEVLEALNKGKETSEELQKTFQEIEAALKYVEPLI